MEMTCCVLAVILPVLLQILQVGHLSYCHFSKLLWDVWWLGFFPIWKPGTFSCYLLNLFTFVVGMKIISSSPWEVKSQYTQPALNYAEFDLFWDNAHESSWLIQSTMCLCYMVHNKVWLISCNKKKLLGFRQEEVELHSFKEMHSFMKHTAFRCSLDTDLYSCMYCLGIGNSFTGCNFFYFIWKLTLPIPEVY